jgi:hypothetical protein
MVATFESVLQELLLLDAFCGSEGEALAIIDAINYDAVEQCDVSLDLVLDESHIDQIFERSVSQSLQEHIDISNEDAISIIQKCRIRLRQNADGGDTVLIAEDLSSNDDESMSSEIDSDSDDCNSFVTGACDLCERENVKLTKHHMIPKSTYNRIEPKLIRAVLYHLNTDANHDSKTSHGGDDGLIHLIPVTIETMKSIERRKPKLDTKLNSKVYIRTIQKAVRHVLKQQTTDICRPCHSMIHRTHDNMSLAITYNTVDKLLQDEAIYKFSKWCNKQKTHMKI